MNKETDHIGQIIIKAREKQHLSRMDLSKRLGIPYSSLSSLENDNASGKSVYLYQIADALGLTVRSMPGGGITLIDSGDTRVKTEYADVLPVLSAADVLQFIGDDGHFEYPQDAFDQKLYRATLRGLHSDMSGFWLDMDNRAMDPAVRAGERILINTDLSAESGDIVLAWCQGDQSCLVRRYVSEGGHELLIAENPSWPNGTIGIKRVEMPNGFQTRLVQDGNPVPTIIIGVATDASRQLN